MTRSSCSFCSSSSSPSGRVVCRFKCSVVRSFVDILLRFAGGWPSFSFRVVEVLESIPSGAGEPLVEVCCDAGGEG